MPTGVKTGATDADGGGGGKRAGAEKEPERGWVIARKG